MPQNVFAIQVEHVMDNCIVTALWHRPDNTAGNYEIKDYNIIFANGTNLSNDTIFSGATDDNSVIANLLFVPGCAFHNVSVSAVNVCDHPGPQSNPAVELDPDDCHRSPNNITLTMILCNTISYTDSGSKTNAGMVYI